MIEIRKLTRQTSLNPRCHLQQEIWGFADVELLPLRLFVVADKIGGQVLGASTDPMVAFCLGVPGLKPGGKYYLHSHMLGVLPEYRNSGLGRQMKLKQREEALQRGIELIEWTFDPLEIKNAYFNIERLGAIVRRFVHNQYGTTSSHLHGGLPTDRCTAEWWIESAACRSGLRAGSRPASAATSSESRCQRALRELAHVRSGDAHGKYRSDVAEQFVQVFQRGLAVIGFEKTEDSGKLPPGRMGIKLDRDHLCGISKCRLCISSKPVSAGPMNATSFWWKRCRDGVSGWGEVTAGENPFYNEEWTGSIWPLLQHYVVPRILEHRS